MGHPDIREFDWADFSAVTDVRRAAGRDVLAAEELHATLEHEPGLMLVARVSGKVAGVVLGTYDGRRGWIHRLAVHPTNRRAGLASALVGELEQRFRDRGAPRINLLVMPDNADGLAFWQRLGYLPYPDVLCSKPL